jgi:hypothetical protein
MSEGNESSPAATPAALDDHASRRVSALMVDLMIRDGIPPHVIGAALVANLTIILCSASPSVAVANRAINEAVVALKANKRLVPGLVAKASAGRHAAEPAIKAGLQ